MKIPAHCRTPEFLRMVVRGAERQLMSGVGTGDGRMRIRVDDVPAAAVEVANTAYVRVMESPDPRAPIESWLAWFRGVTANVIRERIRAAVTSKQRDAPIETDGSDRDSRRGGLEDRSAPTAEQQFLDREHGVLCRIVYRRFLRAKIDEAQTARQCARREAEAVVKAFARVLAATHLDNLTYTEAAEAEPLAPSRATYYRWKKELLGHCRNAIETGSPRPGRGAAGDCEAFEGADHGAR